MTASHLQFQFIEIESADAMGWFRLVKKMHQMSESVKKLLEKPICFCLSKLLAYSIFPQ